MNRIFFSKKEHLLFQFFLHNTPNDENKIKQSEISFLILMILFIDIDIAILLKNIFLLSSDIIYEKHFFS